ncbi:MAG: phospholipase D-like domain-containing protein, partial [Syntrophales bacterium]|nr:phospholipase D-like domain-containing protein [Syntrophales bacterium]
MKSIILSLCIVMCAGLALVPPPISASTFDDRLKGETVQFLENERYFKVLVDTFEKAREEIILAFFLFKTNGHSSNYPDRILESLARAARRGVSVRVLLEKTNDENSFIDKANAETAERLRSAGIPVEFDRSSTRTHVKMIVVDREILFVGSHNMTNSGLKYNNEVS